MPSDLPPRVSIMGIPVDPWTMEQTVERACRYVESGSFAHFIGVNADKFLQMRDDPAMEDVVRRCEVVNADGSSICIAARKFGIALPERVAGIDLMLRLCAVARDRGYRVFLLGARDDVVRQTETSLERRYPGIQVVGARDGYFGREHYAAVADEVAAEAPDLVFVGITSPKKEEVIEFCRERGLHGVFVGVGGSFDVVSGNLARAPRWMQSLGLEWLFRMLQEPGRLFKRYAGGNWRFMRLVHRELKAARRQTAGGRR